MSASPNRKISDLPYASGATKVFVSVADVNTQKSMWVSTGELASLVAAGVAGTTAKDQEITRFEIGRAHV